MYDFHFGARDPVAEPGTATGTPGDWWSVFALVPDVMKHAVEGFTKALGVELAPEGIRVVSVYVPNGREPDSDHYRYKLAWLSALKQMVAGGPEATVVCGDMRPG